MQVKTMVNGELVTSRPRSNHTDHYMLYDGKHLKDALIDEETFSKVNERFHSDKTKANLTLVNPLAGLLMCPNCGKVMHYQSYKHKAGSVSPRFIHKQSNLCKVKSVMASDVMNALIHALKLYIEDFEMKVDNLPDVDENTIQSQIDTLEKEMLKVKRKLNKVFDDYEEGVYTANEFVERKAKHNQRLEAIQKQIDDLENSIPEKDEYEEMILKLSDTLAAVQDETLDADVKNAYLKQVLDRIEFTRENDEEFILDLYLK